MAAMLSIRDVGLKSGMTVAVIGDDRIADLCRFILQREGLICCCDLREYDAIVLCSPVKDVLLEKLKPGGTLVIKTRLPVILSFDASDILNRRIKVIGANYSPFKDAISYIENHAESLTRFIGSSFRLADYEQAFSRPNDKKSFFNICVD